MLEFNRKNKAVALKYNADVDKAPVIIASGSGDIANKIIDIAEQNGYRYIGTTARPRLCVCLKWGNSIPPELYEVIAAIYCQLLKASKDIKTVNSEK